MRLRGEGWKEEEQLDRLMWCLGEALDEGMEMGEERRWMG